MKVARNREGSNIDDREKQKLITTHERTIPFISFKRKTPDQKAQRYLIKLTMVARHHVLMTANFSIDK